MRLGGAGLVVIVVGCGKLTDVPAAPDAEADAFVDAATLVDVSVVDSNDSSDVACVAPQPIASSVCDAFYDSFVAYIEKCGNLALTSWTEAGVLDAAIYDPFSARAAVVDHYCNNLPTAPGTTHLESELVACTNALTQALTSCSNGTASVACNARGTLPPGATCAYHEQCASGWCVVPKNGVDYQPGICSPLIALGGACTPNSDDVCGVGAYCNYVSHVCMAYAQQGQACDGTKGIQCEVGTICDDLQTHTCIALPQPGQPCLTYGSGSVCAWAYACVNGTCALPSGIQPSPTCGTICNVLGDAGFSSCTCAQGSLCPGWNVPCEPVRNVGDACNSNTYRCGVTYATPRHNPWLACVNGTCQEPTFGCP